MRFWVWLTISGLSVLSNTAWAENRFEAALSEFVTYYQTSLGDSQRCMTQRPDTVKACSARLRNEGNAPFILHHGEKRDAVVVLFHGLSDSPFYLHSLANAIHQQGNNVVVALLPGHGLAEADADMQDPTLAERWQVTVEDVVGLSQVLGNKLFVGGFSAGATLATHYALSHPEGVDGLLLFSAALALSENAEQLSRIWGMQSIAKWIDGDYLTHGPNPYKYPEVSLFAALELMQVIRQVRELMVIKAPNIATFAAHSAADVTTPMSGLTDFLQRNKAENTTFIVDERYNLCHGDLLLDAEQIRAINFSAPVDEIVDFCLVPEANPLHAHMLAMLMNFMQEQTSD
ncbi:alpha/beta hydrolase [Alteromonas facilis]|uniref:alpha/beta hydrolase n=1 Tax=Alteromonas facilis TaxID=2048004 RepID=UPI000C28FBE9|nr:alpha/beta fold hydrolase [Alteromonas facilis]